MGLLDFLKNALKDEEPKWISAKPDALPNVPTLKNYPIAYQQYLATKNILSPTYPNGLTPTWYDHPRRNLLRLEADIDKPITGYRLYTARTNNYPGYINSNVLLQGTRGHYWVKAELEATCAGDPAICVDHLRSDTCHCGIYVVPDKRGHSYWHMDRLRRTPYPVVEAKVKAWGVCVEGEIGVRSQFAEIQDLTVLQPPCVSCRNFAAVYLTHSMGFCKYCFDSHIEAAYSGETITLGNLVEQLWLTYKVPVRSMPMVYATDMGVY